MGSWFDSLFYCLREKKVNKPEEELIMDLSRLFVFLWRCVLLVTYDFNDPELLGTRYFRCAISCPCTLSGCPVYARRRVLDSMRGVPLKCFL